VTIEAKIVADSRCLISGNRITTMQLRYPRIIHAEVMTHRVFSRNASSSRAVPVKKLIEEARTDPAMPVRFGANQPGMQDKGGHFDALVNGLDPEQYWRWAARQAADIAQAYDLAGFHKQVCNRILEPFTHINLVVTSTQWANFFALRCHEDADPTMRALADAMFQAREQSVPTALTRHDWHLPYIADWDRENLSTQQLLISSAARCARVSYNKHNGSSPSFEDDLATYEKLVTSNLVHASPLEHQAMPDPDGFSEHLWGNFHGFIQFRKTISNEAIHD
jgi:thymidylate synthase ThyX